MRDKKRKTRRGKREKGGGARISSMKEEEARRALPGFSAESSLRPTTTSQLYHLTRTYAQTAGAPTISSAASFLHYLCYYKCMIECSIICSPPRMCLISCPQQCRAQCGLFGIL
jgi:hypothetical protein